MNDGYEILVVDDDENICNIIRLYLEKQNYHIKIAHRGDIAIAIFKKAPPHLIILDIMLPGMDGWQVCREVRKVSNIPIIMLTAKGEIFDKVLGLELGADDYLVKPFDPKELVARIKAVIRRTQNSDTPEQQLIFPNLVINMSKYNIFYHGEEMDLPPKELELLYYLANHKNKVFTREQLLEQVWGFDYYGDTRTVDVHIKRVREKFTFEEPSWQIKTVWGVGYKFEVK